MRARFGEGGYGDLSGMVVEEEANVGYSGGGSSSQRKRVAGRGKGAQRKLGRNTFHARVIL